MDLDCTESCQLTCCPISEEVKEYEEEQAMDVDSEMTLVPERRVNDRKTGIKIPREKVLAGRKAEMEEMMNHHLFDEVPEGDAVGNKLIRAKLQARQRLVAMEIAAFEGKRDDKHAMTPPLKVAQMLVSRAETGSKARRRVWGIHDIRVAFFHAPVEDERYVRMHGRRAHWGRKQSIAP